MSLAAVHMLFITLSTLLAVAVGVWEVRDFASSGSASALVWGLVSLVAVPLLVVYGVRVRRKLKALGGFST